MGKRKEAGSSKQKSQGEPSNTKAAQPEPKFDANKFENSGAVGIYNKLVGKEFICERGIEVEELIPVKEQIAMRGWEIFVRTPPRPVVPIVLEFCANGLHKNDDGETCGWVRRIKIPLTIDAITEVTGLPRWPEEDWNHRGCFYSRHREDPNWREVYTTICHPNADCIKPNAKSPPEKIPRQQLTGLARFWNLFVVYRLFPTRNENHIDRERAFLLYCIISGKPIDAATIIHSNLLAFLGDIKGKVIYFPCLLTELARQAGVRIDKREMQVTSKKALYDGTITGLLAELAGGPPHPDEEENMDEPEDEPEVPPPQSSPPQPTMIGDMAQLLQTMHIEQLEQRRLIDQLLQSQQMMQANQLRVWEHTMQLQHMQMHHSAPSVVLPPIPHLDSFDFGGAHGYGRGSGERGSRASGTEEVGGQEAAEEEPAPIDED